VEQHLLNLPFALERVSSTASPLFSSCLRVLANSIPISEQLPEDRLIRLLAHDNYRLYALRDDLDVVAFATLYLSGTRPIALLDYMGVRRDLQGQGIGSAFFRMLVDIAHREEPTANWLMIEVDDDREGIDRERETNRRRIAFYRRLGAQLLENMPYRFPSTAGNPVPMRLMVFRLRPEATLSPAVLRLAIEDIFLRIHGRDAGDPLLGWIVAQEPAALRLE
jgi:GNAT superfamily N-acetyltransferase